MWGFDRLQAEIKTRMAGKDLFLLAIDGPCGSGKTTLARQLEERLACQVVHMDDFFLRPEQRTAQRLNTPGGNVDYERFLTEVLLPLRRGETACYRPYDCGTQSLGAPVTVEPRGLVLLEGSYSCHPALREHLDFRVFLTVSRPEQLRRIKWRSPEKLQMFIDRWIPLEERYFAGCGVREACDIQISTEA